MKQKTAYKLKPFLP